MEASPPLEITMATFSAKNDLHFWQSAPHLCCRGGWALAKVFLFSGGENGVLHVPVPVFLLMSVLVPVPVLVLIYVLVPVLVLMSGHVLVLMSWGRGAAMMERRDGSPGSPHWHVLFPWSGSSGTWGC